MPAISKIRFTNIIYENGGKRYNDDIFQFDGYNGAIVLENGGGKTVFVQTALQAILPHYNMEERKIRDTLSLEGNPCHIAIEWVLNERPRKYLVTAVTLFLTNNKLDSYRYVYEYSFDDDHNIDNIPFVKDTQDGSKRPASKGEIADYYQYMQSKSMNAKLFRTIGEYHKYIEENYKIIPSEWKSIARINDAEGGVEGYFENCRTTSQLVDRLLIPVVEEAISENATKDFAKTFEEQRDRFKKHRQLRERIDESKEIAKQIDEYVTVFTDYHNVNKDFIREKQYAKAIYLYIKNEETNIEENINRNQLDKQEIQSLYKELKRKEISYDLSILKEKLDENNRELKEAEKLFTEVRHEYDNKSQKLNNLKIAKLKQEIKEAEDSIKNYEGQIKILESEIDIEEIKDKLEENSSKLRNSFMNEEEELNKEKIVLVNAESAAREEHSKVTKKLKDLQIIKEDIIKEISQKKGQKIEKENGLKKTRDKIIGLSPTEDIKDQQHQWIAKVGYLEKASVESSKLIKELENEKINIDIQLDLDRNKLGKLGKDHGVIDNKINSLNQIHDRLLLEAKVVNDSWYYVDSLYSKQDSIINYMASKVENLIKEKENLLLEERISSRFKDDYEDSSYFTSEPLLEKWITSWKSQFKYIETGSQYIQRAINTLSINEEELLNTYPFWSISIVVDDLEVEIARDRLFKNIEKITSPILILGQEEALKLVKEGRDIKELIIMPKYWTENMNQEFFTKWKSQVTQKVKEVIEKRKLKEEEITSYNDCLKALREFFNQYSYDYYSQLKEEKITIEKSYESLERDIKNKENRLKEIHSEVSKQNQQIINNNYEINSLNQWIGFAHEYIIGQREIGEITSLLHQLNNKERQLEIDLTNINKDISRREDIIKGLEHEIGQFTDRINSLLDDSLYKEVKNVIPIFTNISRGSLIEERKNLKDILHEQQGDIKKYEEFIRKEEKTKNRLVKELEQVKKQSDYPINEDFLFPSYGEDEIDSLIEEIERIKPIKKELESRFKGKEMQYNESLAKYKANEEQFYKEFDEMIIFKDSLYNVKALLDREKVELNSREKINIETYNKLLKGKASIDGLIMDMQMKNEKYEYLIDIIEPTRLGEDFYRDFPYNRARFIKNTLKMLEELQDKLKEFSYKLEDQKSKFIFFCNDKIKDPRLRERTVSGVKQKTNYEEVLNWQSKMKKSIETTIKIAEDDIREHDKDLEQFINHLCTYLRTLTDELNIIPKKTRIKIEDKWKEVYQFNIPEWEEEEGKEEIRKHVDWMLRQLDSSEFKNEDGTDNNGKITKEIEKWLDSRQLLPIVLKNNQIKVSCRKVTNDGKISGALNTWESSNRWSGGEKWSKNMTLFLGILNYVAEKRQGILTGLKTNRTVIVDNPFGKASSDHVLDPVFFIAEKLGFQIIALTAHTEGSFIRNYFPVVYSCRLREATNNSSLIIDKEKEIHYAFFRDKDPETLDRLEDKKQLTLFG